MARRTRKRGEINANRAKLRENGAKVKKSKEKTDPRTPRTNDEYEAKFGVPRGAQDTRAAKGRKSPNYFEFKGEVYDLSERGQGMILAVIDRHHEIITSASPSAEQIDEIAEMLVERDRQTGKPPKKDYRKTARQYRLHARKHMGLGKSKECTCTEFAPAFQARLDAAQFSEICPRWTDLEAANAAAAAKVKAATETAEAAKA